MPPNKEPAMKSKFLMQIAMPGAAAAFAFAVAVGTNHSVNASHDVVLAPMDGSTPYSADHARAQKSAPDSEQAPTF
jgi:hypothetical protein